MSRLGSSGTLCGVTRNENHVVTWPIEHVVNVSTETFFTVFDHTLEKKPCNLSSTAFVCHEIEKRRPKWSGCEIKLI